MAFGPKIYLLQYKNNPVKSAPLKTEHSVRSRKALVYRGSE